MGGILAWYSLIHTEPEQIGDILTEFARCLRPEGSLMVGFFEGVTREPFDHAVTRVYRWPVQELTNRVEAAGFTVTDTQTRTDPGSRPHGAIVAQRLR